MSLSPRLPKNEPGEEEEFSGGVNLVSLRVE